MSTSVFKTLILLAAVLCASHAAAAGKCKTHEFACKTNGECVGFEYICDGLNHCNDGSDELFCSNINNQTNKEGVDKSPQVDTNQESPLDAQPLAPPPKFSALATFLLPPNPPSENESVSSSDEGRSQL